MSLDPMHQFEVHKIMDIQAFGYDISLTNQSVWMLGATLVVSLLLILGSRKKALIPGRGQVMVEMIHDFVLGTLTETTGEKGKKFFPFVFALFIFIASLNLAGMIPFHSYTSTSNIFINGAMALVVFALVWVFGLWMHGFKFFTIFAPKGAPLILMPLIIPLEIFSFFARPFTLAVRLAANMVAGHVLLKVFAYFCVALGAYFAVPLLALTAFTALEFFIALLQAYIFTILTCVYLNDAVNLH